MNPRLALTFILTALVVVACDRSGGTGGSATADGPDRAGPVAEVGTSAGEAGGRVAPDAGTGAVEAGTGPLLARAYPGARVVSAVTDPSNTSGLITFQTDAQPGTVVAYYRERAEEAGLTPRADMTMGDTRQFGADDGAGAELNVTIEPGGAQSTVTVAWDGVRG